MKKWQKIGKKGSYFFGTFIPNVTFVIIFLTFMVNIISRYVLKAPVAWTYEVSILAYMWTMFFGVGKAMIRDEHVVFGLVYDNMGPRFKLVFKITSNILLIILITIVFIPSVNSLISKKMVTGVLNLPFTVVFAPLIFMFAEIIIRSVIDLKKNLIQYKNEITKNKNEVFS